MNTLSIIVFSIVFVGLAGCESSPKPSTEKEKEKEARPIIAQKATSEPEAIRIIETPQPSTPMHIIEKTETIEAKETPPAKPKKFDSGLFPKKTKISRKDLQKRLAGTWTNEDGGLNLKISKNGRVTIVENPIDPNSPKVTGKCTAGDDLDVDCTINGRKFALDYIEDDRKALLWDTNVKAIAFIRTLKN